MQNLWSGMFIVSHSSLVLASRFFTEAAEVIGLSLSIVAFFRRRCMSCLSLKLLVEPAFNPTWQILWFFQARLPLSKPLLVKTFNRKFVFQHLT